MQFKQAGPSVYEPFLGPSRYPEHGRRVVNGQRLHKVPPTPSSGGPTRRSATTAYYVRRFRDGKVVPNGEEIAGKLAAHAFACGHVLACAHRRSGDVAAINDYLGKSDQVEDAFTRFAFAYDDQTARDHAQLAEAIEAGRIAAIPRLAVIAGRHGNPVIRS